MGFVLAVILSLSVSIIVFLFIMVTQLLRKVRELDYSVDTLGESIGEKFEAQNEVMLHVLHEHRRLVEGVADEVYFNVHEDLEELAQQIDSDLEDTGNEIVSALQQDDEEEENNNSGNGGDEIESTIQAPFLDQDQKPQYLA